jgi:hypothetical protein
VGASGSSATLGQVIRKFLKEKNDPAPFNHVWLIGKLTRDRWGYLDACGVKLPREWVGRFIVVEAVWTVRCCLLADYLKQNADMCIIRDTSLTKAERDTIFDAALEQVGLGYSVSKLLAYGIDILFGSNLSAKTGPQDLVCSTLVAKAFAKAKRFFEGLRNVRKVTPDNIWDTGKSGPPWAIFWRKYAKPEKPHDHDEWNTGVEWPAH